MLKCVDCNRNYFNGFAEIRAKSASERLAYPVLTEKAQTFVKASGDLATICLNEIQITCSMKRN